MHKLNKNLHPYVIDKGLIVGKYKGDDQAKRIMMKAGLPIDVISKVLSEDKNLTEKTDK
jgi:hypothetical protein